MQPIFFSHVIHAGSYKIECQYCHTGARRGPSAGLPSVERCMGCHKIVAQQGNPEVDKLKGYWERKEPIPWVRIFKLPEHAQFPHKNHVQAGLPCQTCHGRVEAMERVHAGPQGTGQSIVNDLKNLAAMPDAPNQAHDGLVRRVPPRREQQRPGEALLDRAARARLLKAAEGSARLRHVPPLTST